MYEMRFEAIKELIVAKKYTEARVILKTIDDPQARQLEAQLNRLEPSFLPLPAPPAIHTHKRKFPRRDAAIFFGIILVCFLVMNMYGGLIPRAKVSDMSGRDYDLMMQTATVHKAILKLSETPWVLHLDPVSVSAPHSTEQPVLVETLSIDFKPKTVFAKLHAQLRSCPRMSCDVVTELPVGHPIYVDSVVAGDPSPTYVHVWYPVYWSGSQVYADSLDFSFVPP